MGTKKTTNGKPKASPAAQKMLAAAQAETVQIPKIEFNRQIDRLMTAQRLALALHRIGAKGDPATLLADATDTLGIAAGIDSDELEPE
jgi:hypothetical protein